MVRLKASNPAKLINATQYFNSTMVRLKDRGTCSIIQANQYFNSTMVRLKVPPPASPCLSLSDFNSTMVRLKGCQTGAGFHPDRMYFNSTMVRLKAIARAEMNGKKIYFNSTMVRLKVFGIALSYLIKLFQFHYGTIKSNFFHRCFGCFFRISIPLWYD